MPRTLFKYDSGISFNCIPAHKYYAEDEKIVVFFPLPMHEFTRKSLALKQLKPDDGFDSLVIVAHYYKASIRTIDENPVWRPRYLYWTMDIMKMSCFLNADALEFQLTKCRSIGIMRDVRNR